MSSADRRAVVRVCAVVVLVCLPVTVVAQEQPSKVTAGIIATGASLGLVEVSGREPTEAPSNQIGGHEAHGLLYRLSFASAVVAHGADLSTTAWCLGKATCVEANPALGWASDKPIPLAVVKMGTAAGLLLITHRIGRSRPKLAMWLNVAQTVAFSALAVRNSRFSNEDQR